jgi:hypothetical protein
LSDLRRLSSDCRRIAGLMPLYSTLDISGCELVERVGRDDDDAQWK